MSGPVDYQTPLRGSICEYLSLRTGYGFQDTVSRAALWQAIIPAPCQIIILPTAAAYSGWWAWRNWAIARADSLVLHLLVAIGGGACEHRHPRRLAECRDRDGGNHTVTPTAALLARKQALGIERTLLADQSSYAR